MAESQEDSTATVDFSDVEHVVSDDMLEHAEVETVKYDSEHKPTEYMETTFPQFKGDNVPDNVKVIEANTYVMIEVAKELDAQKIGFRNSVYRFLFGGVFDCTHPVLARHKCVFEAFQRILGGVWSEQLQRYTSSIADLLTAQIRGAREACQVGMTTNSASHDFMSVAWNEIDWSSQAMMAHFNFLFESVRAIMKELFPEQMELVEWSLLRVKVVGPFGATTHTSAHINRGQAGKNAELHIDGRHVPHIPIPLDTSDPKNLRLTVILYIGEKTVKEPKDVQAFVRPSQSQDFHTLLNTLITKALANFQQPFLKAGFDPILPEKAVRDALEVVLPATFATPAVHFKFSERPLGAAVVTGDGLWKDGKRGGVTGADGPLFVIKRRGSPPDQVTYDMELAIQKHRTHARACLLPARKGLPKRKAAPKDKSGKPVPKEKGPVDYPLLSPSDLKRDLDNFAGPESPRTQKRLEPFKPTSPTMDQTSVEILDVRIQEMKQAVTISMRDKTKTHHINVVKDWNSYAAAFRAQETCTAVFLEKLKSYLREIHGGTDEWDMPQLGPTGLVEGVVDETEGWPRPLLKCLRHFYQQGRIWADKKKLCKDTAKAQNSVKRKRAENQVRELEGDAGNGEAVSAGQAPSIDGSGFTEDSASNGEGTSTGQTASIAPSWRIATNTDNTRLYLTISGRLLTRNNAPCKDVIRWINTANVTSAFCAELGFKKCMIESKSLRQRREANSEKEGRHISAAVSRLVSILCESHTFPLFVGRTIVKDYQPIKAPSYFNDPYMILFEYAAEVEAALGPQCWVSPTLLKANAVEDVKLASKGLDEGLVQRFQEMGTVEYVDG
ncbi:hypothetical protein HDV00_004361 [Rhizophlyctis rosea]|nr:hypothetical protein HDV00_004361 [Rhizophlyctis rosea]